MPRTESNALGGLPFTSADVCHFRAHGPRMRLDDRPTPSSRFIARVSASVATVDSSPGHGWVSGAADNDFVSVSAVPTAVSEGSAEALATTTSVVQQFVSRSSVQEIDSVKPVGPIASLLRRPLRRPSPRATASVSTWSGSTALPDDDVVFGPHLHSDALAFSKSSW